LPLPDRFGRLGVKISVFSSRRIDEDAHVAAANGAGIPGVRVSQVEVKQYRLSRFASINRVLLGLALDKAAADGSPNSAGSVDDCSYSRFLGGRTLGSIQHKGDCEWLAFVNELHNSLVNAYGSGITVHSALLESTSQSS
jgi:hypothetical protein